jgi:hypothetical protein
MFTRKFWYDEKEIRLYKIGQSCIVFHSYPAPVAYGYLHLIFNRAFKVIDEHGNRTPVRKCRDLSKLGLYFRMTFFQSISILS